jgi:hypothetical protein
MLGKDRSGRRIGIHAVVAARPYLVRPDAMQKEQRARMEDPEDKIIGIQRGLFLSA